ncbi:MAG: type II secretion system ATPase GspE [Gammaproteobacteria bacterium]|nr:type II secretion system ATPase GspE [Gammaproteobacteria bacterium]MDH5800575.1 type II secretion system ATPase GspE [Gammaproteobacteria bacterium]
MDEQTLSHESGSVPDALPEPTAEIASAARQLPFAFAKRHGVLVTEQQQGKAQVLCRPGVTPAILAEIRRYLQVPIKLNVVHPDEFDGTLQRAYEQDSDHAMQMMDDLDDEADLFQVAEQLPEPEDLLESEDDAPIIRLINAIFTQAIKEDASDIHIEPFETKLTVRFRVDGVLREVLSPRRVLAPLIVSRIKVMAKLDIAEKRLPQDGRISLLVAGRPVDVRVSTIPTGQGERVVLRLLDKQAGRLDLEHLGMNPVSLNVLERVIHRPHGILLVTGPTGSGKTTTLYAGISSLNNNRRNIMTVEDPIEYNLEGVSQTNVNSKVDMSFARGLRAILRQDPDVVMVGEIRDLETAEIAVQASLTGHLVLSTLHTNSAVGAVTRLRDMGVEPFLLSSSLLGVLAQRLVRILCHECKEPYTPNELECERFGFDSANPPQIFKPKGCAKCNYQGYRGRTGIYELIEVDDNLRDMIHDGSGEHALEAYARNKSAGIRQDGLRRVTAGDTSLDEVVRVTREG